MEEGGGGEEGLFHVTPHSTKAQAGKEAQDKTCVPTDATPPPCRSSASATLQPPSLFFHAQTQPLPSADDLNIYQTARWRNSS